MAANELAGYGLFDRTPIEDPDEILYSTEGILKKGGFLANGQGPLKGGTVLSYAHGYFAKYDNSVNGTNAVYTLTETGTPTGGAFTLKFTDPNGGGVQETANIAQAAANTAVRDALAALPGIGTGNVAVTGSAGGPYTVTFQGDLAAEPITLALGANALTGGTNPTVTVVATTPGVANLGVAVAILAYDADTTETGRPEACNVYFKGNFKTSKLIGLDANAITDLAAVQNSAFGFTRIG